MAVEKMRLLSIFGNYDDLDKAIKVCIDSGNFQPENASSLIGGSEGFSYISEENPYSFRLMKIREIFESFEREPKFIGDCSSVDIDEANRRVDELYLNINIF